MLLLSFNPDSHISSSLFFLYSSSQPEIQASGRERDEGPDLLAWSISRFLLCVHSPWIHSWFFILFKGGKYRIDGRQLRTVSLGKPSIPASDPNHNISPVCFVKIYHSSAPSMDSNLRCGLLDHTIL